MGVVFLGLHCPSDMAPKEKRGKRFSPKKQTSGAIPWPDVPKQLLYTIGRQKHLLRSVTWGGICKSWRAAAKQCSPTGKTSWIQLSCSNDNSGEQYHDKPQGHVLSIPFLPGEYFWISRKRRPDPWMHFKGCSHGLIITAMDTANNYVLHDPFWAWWYPPTWDARIPFRFATLSSYPRDPNGWSIMVLTGISRPAFVISRLGKSAAWIQHNSTLVDPYSSENQSIIFTNAIGFKGKFYALSLQGALAVVEEEVDSEFRITGLGKNRAVPSGLSKHFTEYLFESNGEIFLVFLISRNSKKIMDDVEVFRLDLARLSWVKMESLGDRTLFLGTKCCTSVSSRQVGSKVNFVYFIDHTTNGWHEFDMGTGSIHPCNDMDSIIESPAWNEPISVE